MSNFKTGDDFICEGEDAYTYGIHVTDPNETLANPEWGNKIEVYGDEKLRDLVLKLLQDHESD